MSWQRGEAVVRREIVNGAPWLGWMVTVVEDSPGLLATYSPEGSPFHFPDGDWPTPDGVHPWSKYAGWVGSGALMLQRPGDPYAIWHFWDGPDHTFRGWYLNFEAPFERTEIGFDTLDYELDIEIASDGTWQFKDVDLLWQRHDEGRFTLLEVRRILELGRAIGDMLDSGNVWWGEDWIDWRPDPRWSVPEIPPAWDQVPTTL